MKKIEAPEEEPLWIKQALRGDAQSFSRLVETYATPVHNLCYRMLGNGQDAEDAAQETFLRAFQSLYRFDPSRPFSTWLLSIAAHYCIDQIRKRRMQIISVEDLPDPDLLEPGPGAETALSSKQERQKIQRTLAILNSTDRAAVIMYYWYDFSYEEICQALSISMSALKSRLHRSRRLLAEEWIRQQESSGISESTEPSCSGKLTPERMAP